MILIITNRIFFIIIRGQIGGHGPTVIKKARMTWAGGGDAEGRARRRRGRAAAREAAAQDPPGRGGPARDHENRGRARGERAGGSARRLSERRRAGGGRCQARPGPNRVQFYSVSVHESCDEPLGPPRPRWSKQRGMREPSSVAVKSGGCTVYRDVR